MEAMRAKRGFICDMDGVIYHGDRLLPGVREFVDWLYNNDKKFLFLTNNSSKTPLELKLKLKNMGLDVDETHFYTSALATAKFVSQQSPQCSAYVIGDSGLIGALYQEGIAITDKDPDYVIVGESSTYNYQTVNKAVSLVLGGAISVVTILAYTAIAGMVGAGGLGNIAIQYGHNRGVTSLMWVTVVLLIIFVQIVQWIFSWWSRRIDKRLGQTADTGKFAPLAMLAHFVHTK